MNRCQRHLSKWGVQKLEFGLGIFWTLCHISPPSTTPISFHNSPPIYNLTQSFLIFSNCSNSTMAIPSNKVKEMWAHEDVPMSSGGDVGNTSNEVESPSSKGMFHGWLYELPPLSQSTKVLHRSQ